MSETCNTAKISSNDFRQLSTEILHRGGFLRFKARGSSMSPFVPDGAVVVVEPIQTSQVKFGDVVLCSSEKETVIHRAVGKCILSGKPAFKIRGDNAPGSVEKFLTTEVLGRVVSVEYRGRIINLNSTFFRWAGLLWAVFPGLVKLFKRLNHFTRVSAVGFMSILQSNPAYRRAANRLIGTRVKYRTATSEDAFEISKFLGYWSIPETQDPVAKILEKIERTKGPSHVFIATLGDRIIGAIVIQRFPEPVISGPDWWISEIRVRARYRGAGIARGLIIKASLKAKQSGAKELGGDVSEQNRKSVAMCENLHGSQMKPQEYSAIFPETSAHELDRHIIFHRPIDEGLQKLQSEGVLDRYKGTGCLDL